VVKVNMTDYIKGMIKKFPEQLPDSSKNCPWNENLFKVNSAARPLTIKKAQVFHTFVAKVLFLSKRARYDIQPAIVFLTTQVRSPNEDDWDKLRKMMHYLKHTQDVLTLKADGTCVIKWHIDASFAVHNDFKSHTGGVMIMGQGAIQTIST
jgi:hypothetical protein